MIFLKNKAKPKRVMLTLIVLASLFTASLAWRDLSQFKTNAFASASVENNVVLVEDFQEIKNWRVGEPVKKSVLVRNGQESDDPSRFHYENAYVRVHFTEYMEIGSREYIYHGDRMMTDEHGNFFRFHSEEEAKRFEVDHGLNQNARIRQVKGHYDDSNAPSDGYFYLLSQEFDPNGQYGKFLIVGVTTSDANSLVAGVDKDKDLGNGQPGESAWTTHRWANNQESGYAAASPFTNYVTWQLGANVIALEAWDKKPVAKWILDTQSDQGWAYWGQPLEHAQHGVENVSLTSKLLETVSLTKQPDGQGEYYVHAHLDAVSWDALKSWNDAPHSVVSALSQSNSAERERLKKIIEKVEATRILDLDTPSIAELKAAYQEARSIYDGGQQDYAILTHSIDRLTKALKDFLTSSETLRIELLKEIEGVEKIDLSHRTKQSAQNLRDAITQAYYVYTMPSITPEAQNQAIQNLHKAIARLNDLKGLEAYRSGIEGATNHYYVDFAGVRWEVVGLDKDNAILSAAPLTPEQFKQIGLDHLVSQQYANTLGVYNLVKFSDDVLDAYDKSQLRTIVDRFYETYIKGKPEEDMIVPIHLTKYSYGNNNNHLFEFKTFINNHPAVSKGAFVLSTWDIDKDRYQATIPHYPDSTPVWGGGSKWLRNSFANNASAFAVSNETQSVFKYLKEAYHQVKPTIVVKSISLPFSDDVLNQ